MDSDEENEFYGCVWSAAKTNTFSISALLKRWLAIFINAISGFCSLLLLPFFIDLLRHANIVCIYPIELLIKNVHDFQLNPRWLSLHLW